MRREFIAVRVSLVEKGRLQKAARRLGCPISDLVRWALRRELAEAPKTERVSQRLNQTGQ